MVAECGSRRLSRGRQKFPRCRSQSLQICDECSTKGGLWQTSEYTLDGYGFAYGKWYCDPCWLRWFRRRGITDPSPCVETYEGKAVRTFGGQLVHLLQIGLGNFATFLQKDADWLDVLAGASSLARGEALRAIGVDPVEECVGPLERMALGMEGASVVLAAVCEEAGLGKLICLPRGARWQVQEELQEKKVDHKTRAEVDSNLALMENMSCMDVLHSDFVDRMEYIQELSGLTTNLVEERSISCYTFRGLLQMHDASGCEVLIVDAEGSDLAVMRSVIDACSNGPYPWPRVLCFETMGHANNREHADAEEEMVRRLQSEAGYFLVYAYYDVTLVHGPTVRAAREVARWADANFTLKCNNCGWWMSPSSPWFAAEVGSGYAQWCGLSGHQLIGEWCCRCCLEAARAAAGDEAAREAAGDERRA